MPCAAACSAADYSRTTHRRPADEEKLWLTSRSIKNLLRRCEVEVCLRGVRVDLSSDGEVRERRDKTKSSESKAAVYTDASAAEAALVIRAARVLFIRIVLWLKGVVAPNKRCR